MNQEKKNCLFIADGTIILFELLSDSTDNRI